MAWIFKVKANVDVKNHYVRWSTLRILNKYKFRFCPKSPLWLSAQEAFYRQEVTSKHKWLTYHDVLEFSQGDCKMNSREDLMTEWFSYVQLTEKFKADKRLYGLNKS